MSATMTPHGAKLNMLDAEQMETDVIEAVAELAAAVKRATRQIVGVADDNWPQWGGQTVPKHVLMAYLGDVVAEVTRLAGLLPEVKP